MEMIREKELALIKEIIKEGFDNLEIISFELDIPMMELIKIKNEIYTEERRAQMYRQISLKKEESINKIRTIA